MAVVRITVSNASRDAAFIVKALGIDYSHWALSNCDEQALLRQAPFEKSNVPLEEQTVPEHPGARAKRAVATAANSKAPGASGKIPTIELSLHDTDVDSYPCRVNSLELRDARLLARVGQINSRRNVTDRALKGTGVTAGALEAVFRHSSGFARVVTAYNTGVIPAFEDIWKDMSEDQINLLNDVAFRINMVVPKESAVSVTAFFPIDRFLSSDLRELFMKEPAFFFSPTEYLVNTAVVPKKRKRHQDTSPAVASNGKYDQIFYNLLDRFADESPEGERRCAQALCDADQRFFCLMEGAPAPSFTGAGRLNAQKNCELARLLDSVSLNHVFVVATGEFVANVNSLAPEITGVSLDQAADIEAFGQAGKLSGKITGRFLDKANVNILNGEDLGVSVKKTPGGADDSTLKFELTLTKPIANGKSIQFAVTKNADGQDLASNTFEVPVAYTPKDPPEITGPSSGTAGQSISIAGKNFFDTPNYPLTVKITSKAADQKSLVTVPGAALKSSKQVDVVLPANLDKGTHQLEVAVGTTQTSKPFSITVNPKASTDTGQTSTDKTVAPVKRAKPNVKPAKAKTTP